MLSIFFLCYLKDFLYEFTSMPALWLRGEVEEVEGENFKQPLWVNPFFGREDDELDD